MLLSLVLTNKYIHHDSEVSTIHFSPDNQKLLTACSGGRIKETEALTGNQLKTYCVHEGAAFSAAYSPDGTKIVTAGEDGKSFIISLADTSTAKMIQHGRPLLSSSVSPCGKYAAVGSTEGTLCVFDPESGRVLSNIDCGAPVSDVSFSRDPACSLVLVSSITTGVAKIFDVATSEVKASYVLERPQECPYSELSPDGTRALIVCGTNRLVEWTADITTPDRDIATISSTHGNSQILYATYFADGTKILVITTENARIYDRATRKSLGSHPLLSSASAACVSDDGKLIAIGHVSGLVTVLSVEPAVFMEPGVVKLITYYNQVCINKRAAETEKNSEPKKARIENDE